MEEEKEEREESNVDQILLSKHGWDELLCAAILLVGIISPAIYGLWEMYKADRKQRSENE